MVILTTTILGHIDAGYLAGDDEKTWHTTIMCSLRALEDCTVLDGTITIESIKSMIRDPQFEKDPRKRLREDFQRLNNAFVYPKRILNIERLANSTSYDSISEKNPWPDHKVLKYTQARFLNLPLLIAQPIIAYFKTHKRIWSKSLVLYLLWMLKSIQMTKFLIKLKNRDSTRLTPNPLKNPLILIKSNRIFN